MKTTSTTMTIEEATSLYKNGSGMGYPDTEHNKQMMAKVVDNHLLELRANA